MRVLDRKLLRDLWRLKSQVLAIALVLACGVATVVMSFGAKRSLEETRAAYYERQNFAHVFASVTRAPLSLAGDIAAVDGIARAEARIVRTVLVDVPGLAKPALARLVSLAEDPEAGLNALVLRSGRLPESGRTGEAVVSEAFAEANGFRPGDRIEAILNGRKRDLAIVGIGLSPEFVYAIGPGQLVPDNRAYGVFWMPREALEAAFDLDGAFNDVVAMLLPGANEQNVIDTFDRILEPYGATGAYGREDQFSHAFVNHELTQLETIASLVPPVFLGVAAFLIQIVVARLVETEREQIGLLKAFGYSDWEVAGHYGKFVLAIAAGGLAGGAAGGIWLGQLMTEQYRAFFRFPFLQFELDPQVFLWAALIAGIASLSGLWSAMRRVTALAPADAMRPAPPTVYRRTLLERLGVDRLLSAPDRMILRHLERWPVRSLLTGVGIAFSAGLLVMTFFFFDAIEEMIESYYFASQRQDATVTFVEARHARAARELGALDGVRAVEPFRAVAVRLRSGPRSERVALQGLPEQPLLNRPLNSSGVPVSPPPEGLLLSEKLARQLSAGVGDPVLVEVLEGRRARTGTYVAAVFEEYLGMSAYMRDDALGRLIGEGDAVSGAHLLIDRSRTDEIFAELKELPSAAGVTTKWDAIESFRSTMAESMMIVVSFYVGFGAVITFGVVYNAARISLGERGRELATLRVIGFTRAETIEILVGELAILTLAAIPLGFAIGYGLAFTMSAAMDTELFRVPFVILPATYGFAAATVIAAAVLSAAAVAWRVTRLDLVSVLKTRE